MSRAEVEAILGPPADYRTGPSTYDPPLGWYPMPQRLIPTWRSDTGAIAVIFDDSGQVARDEGCEWRTCEKLSDNLLDNMLWQAKRQWHRWFPE
jgi:hypothetical protein